VSKISKKKSSRKFPFKDVTLCLNGELVDERDQVQARLNEEIAQEPREPAPPVECRRGRARASRSDRGGDA
jgi:hypothetical protein